jgi:chromosome segregation ATPase
MTDIVARIEAHLQNDDAAARHWACDNLLEEAQAEIEKLKSYLNGTTKAYERVLSERDNFWKARDETWDENQKLQERIVELDGFVRTMEEQIVAMAEDNRRLRVEAGYD